MSENWYVMQGEDQLGPYSPEQLAGFAVQGNIAPESLVWTEGLENWVPAGQVEGLFPAEAPAAPAGQAFPTAAANASDAHPSYPHVEVQGASFGLWLTSIVLGIFLILLPAIIDALSPAEPPESVALILLGLVGVGMIALLIAAVLACIYLHHAWKCLRPGQLARTTPGRAVGFLFIPFFNLYWIFQAVYGVAIDWNRTITHYPDLKNAPAFSPGLALAFCITTLIFPPAGWILGVVFIAQICRGLNYFAFRPRPSSGTGGFVLG